MEKQIKGEFIKCPKLMGLVKDCSSCTKYHTICKGDSHKIVNHFAKLLREQKMRVA